MTDTPNDTPIEPNAQQNEPTPKSGLIEALRKITENDKGKLAVLRRNAGNSLAEARGVYWFHGLLGGSTPLWDNEACFLVATLFAGDKSAVEHGNQGKGNFGATLLKLKDKKCKSDASRKSMDRHFNTLLDANFDPANGGELAYRLRQMTKRIIAEDLHIDWPQLLNDVKHWNSDKKYIQHTWARSYYTPFTPQDTNEPASPEE